jgi:hypothetical protein
LQAQSINRSLTKWLLGGEITPFRLISILLSSPLVLQVLLGISIYRFFNEMTGFRWGLFGPIPMKPDPLFVPSRNPLTSSTKKSTADTLPDDTLAQFV